MARRLRIAIAEDGRKDFVIAEEANISPESFGSIKQGVTKNPPLDKLRSLARALGKPTSYFTAPLGYVPIEESDDAYASAVAIVESANLSDEYRQAALIVLRDLFARGREQTG